MGKPLDKDEIKRLLPPLASLMDSGKVKYWLCGGILKEVYRNGDIYERHSDIDIHVMEPNIDAVCDLLSTHQKEEFRDFNSPKRESYKVQFARDQLKNDPRQLIIEVMILKNDQNGLYFNQYRSPNIYVPRDCFTDYQLIDVAGIQVKAPIQIDNYLQSVEH